MTRKLKALGLAMVAVFAMSAIAAQGAQAATPGLLTAASYPATLTGTNTAGNIHKFELTALKLSTECTTAKFAGSLASPGSSTITVAPTYEGCKAFGLSATIDTTGCHYLIHIGETLTPGGNYGGTIDAECSGTNLIRITAGIIGNKCEVTVASQTGLSKGEGIAGASDIEVKATVTGIKYTVTKDEGTCPLSKVGETFSDGDYNGNVTVTGSSALSLSD